MPETADSTTSTGRGLPERLMSLDALRGFDMFWITGGGALLTAFAAWLACPDVTKVIVKQTTHVGWDGYVAWDLIFPLFVFLSGVSMPFWISKRIEQGGTKLVLYRRLTRRLLLLVFLGLAPAICRMDWEAFRPFSVLGLIGAANFIAGVIVIHRPVRGQFAWAVGILVGYCLALNLIAVSGGMAGMITPGGVLNGYVDQHLVPGKLYQDVFDPEGLLNILPAAALALLGAMAGHLLRSDRSTPCLKALLLASAGIVCLCLGHLWAEWFPIIKAIWSSSFILVAAGWSLLLLSLFYLVLDVWRLRVLGFIWVPIGMNAITIYVLRSFVDFSHTSNKVFGGLARMSEDSGPLILAAGVLVVEWVLLYFLYCKRIFLRA